MPNNSTNQTTNYTYDGDDNVLTVTAVLPGGAQQETQYVYGVTTATGSAINSNDVLATVEHPDPTTGNPSTTLEDTYTVNALSQPLTATDRNGNVHTYTYDVLGRLTADAITTLGPGVDGSVRRIEIAYDTGGRPYLFTSFDAPTGGNIVNQVQQAYNGLGQLTTEYQSHSGAVNTSSTPNVQYGYTLMAGGQNNSRLTSLTYPSSYVVNFTYASGLNNTISRLSSISDSTATLESYKYLGLGTVVERDHPQPNVNLTYIHQFGDGNANGDGGDQYTGLDRFGRIIDQFFVNGTGQAVDRTQYGYDQDSNRLYAANLVDAVFSNLFQYNSLNELTSYQRGTLNSTRTGLVGNPTDSQSWSLDALGNWSSVTTNGTQQTRTHNAENELTAQNGAGLTYDANGNTTQDAAGNKYIYDAWNRLVKVTTSANAVLAAYGYDALGRRITETHGTTTTDLYYSAAWQVLEERVGGVIQARNVWSPAGVDMLVLRDQSSQHNGTLDQRLYVLQDPNGNVTALVDASGNVLERYAYQPFGTFTIYDPNWNVRSASSYGWLYNFQGKRYDAAAGLYDSRGRDYSPTTGRFQQPDPTQYLSGDPNFYRFVGNAPTDAIDPTGLDGWKRPPGIGYGLGWYNHGHGGFGSSGGGIVRSPGFGSGGSSRQPPRGSTPSPAQSRPWPEIYPAPGSPAYYDWMHQLAVQRRDAMRAAGTWETTIWLDAIFNPVQVDPFIPNFDQAVMMAPAAAMAGRGIGAGISRLRQQGSNPLQYANYAQTSYSNTFSPQGIRLYSQLAGRPINTISDLVAAIRDGSINPQAIPVNYINRPTGTLILNTRTAQALQQAGIPRSQWNTVDQTGNALMERLLSQQLQRNNLTNRGCPNSVPGGR